MLILTQELIFIMLLLSLLLVPFILALGSYLHGGDFVGKGYILAGTTLVLGGMGYLIAGIWGIPIGILANLYYWFVFRTGMQADAELDFMYMADRVSVNRVWIAYLLPVLLATAICIGIFIYIKLFWVIALPILLLPTTYVPAWASKKYADYKQVGFTKELERKARSRVEIFSALAPSSIYIILLIFSLSKLVNYLT